MNEPVIRPTRFLRYQFKPDSGEKLASAKAVGVKVANPHLPALAGLRLPNFSHLPALPYCRVSDSRLPLALRSQRADDVFDLLDVRPLMACQPSAIEQHITLQCLARARHRRHT